LADVHLAAQVDPAFQTSVILPTINTYLNRSILF
jgi:hypothetical protein